MNSKDEQALRDIVAKLEAAWDGDSFSARLKSCPDSELRRN
jgi:hypothetical protein